MSCHRGGAALAPPPSSRILKFGAALGVAVLLSATAACTAAPEPRGAPPPAPQPISPRGATTWPVVFTWQSVAGGGWVYRVTVTDSADRTLTEQDARATRVSAPDELKGILRGRGPFYWRVGIVNGDGTVSASSAPVPFSLK